MVRSSLCLAHRKVKDAAQHSLDHVGAGGDEGRHRVQKTYARLTQKGEEETPGQKEAVLRVVSEVIASNQVMHGLDLQLQMLVSVLVKSSIVAQHTLRLERQVSL